MVFVFGSVKVVGFDFRRVILFLLLFFVGMNYWGLNEKVLDENVCFILILFYYYNF